MDQAAAAPPGWAGVRVRLSGMRAQLALATGIAGIVFGLALISLFQIRAERREVAATQQSLDRTARRIADRLASDLVARQHELVLIADLLQVQPSADGVALRIALDDLARREPTYAWIGLADPHGRVIAASQGVLQGRDVSARPWFTGALKAPYFGDPHEAVMLAKELPPDANGEPLRFVDVALAVRDPRGEVRGVLGGHLHWHWVRDVVDAAVAEERRKGVLEVLIADRQGQWLVKPDTERSRDLAALPGSGAGFLVSRAVSGARAPAQGLGWTVVVRVPAAQALASMYADRPLQLAIACALSALFSWLSWLLAGRLARPVEALSREASELRADQRRTPNFRQGQQARETAALADVMTALVSDLQGRTAQLALFLEHAPAALAMFDVDLRLLTVSLRWCSDFQVAPETAVGRRLSELLPQAPSAWQARFQQAMGGRVDGLHEEEFVHADGARRWLRWEVRPWYRPDGRVGGTLQFVDDVTEARAARERIAADNESLSSRVLAQTAQLRAAKEAAERATLAKSAFLASMSHEIRTPMNGVIGLTHLLARTSLDARQASYVAKILASGQHLLSVINDVLDFSKIEAGRLELDERPFEPQAVLSGVRDLLAPLAVQKGLELIFEVAADVPPTLRGDPLRIGQILINYVGNAIKFTPDGDVLVSMRVSAEGAADRRLRVEVHDTGPGMTQAQLARLFESFEQVGDATSPRDGGTGLGLAISRRLAELMAGQVGVLSTPGRGTTFWLELPLQPAAPAASARAPAAPARARPRALLLDGNARTRHALATLAAGCGADLTACGCVDEAVRAVRAGSVIDIVLVDDAFESGAGDDFSAALPLDGAAWPACLLAIDPDREGLRQRARALGYRRVVAKPVLPSELAELLHGSHVIAAAPASQPLAIAGAGARVLLAEDNPVNRLVATEMIRQFGVAVDVAEDGRQAIAKALSGDYDLVFMDLQMPEVDGLEAARQIRREPTLRALPIIAMTAGAYANELQECLAEGMDDFIPKPIVPEALAAKLRQWLPAEGARAVARNARPAPTTAGGG